MSGYIARVSPPSSLRDLPAGEPPGDAIHIDFEGEAIPAFAGEPVGVALHAAGVDTLARSPKYHRPRGLFCLDGHCASCFLRIDGRPNQRACVTPAREGIVCERQNAFPSVDLDVLAAADWLFPEGMDHHTMMTGSKTGNALFLRLVREMGGSGTLPVAPPERDAVVIDETIDACIVGAGPAGLAAAHAIATATRGAPIRVRVFDEQPLPGGSLHAEHGGSARARTLAAAAVAAGVEILPGATAIGYFPEDETADGGRGLLAVTTGSALRRVRARCTVYGDAPTAAPLVETLKGVGVAAAHATLAVAGKRRPGDIVAVAAVPAPASELARQHGARVAFDASRGGFAVAVDAAGATSVPGVWACGDVTGYVGTAAAQRAGAEVGRAVAAALRSAR